MCREPSRAVIEVGPGLRIGVEQIKCLIFLINSVADQDEKDPVDNNSYEKPSVGAEIPIQIRREPRIAEVRLQSIIIEYTCGAHL